MADESTSGGTTSAETPAERRAAAITAAARFGVTEAEFGHTERLLAEQSGGVSGPGDALWAMSIRAIERFTSARDWDGAGLVYLAQARWLHEHEPGQDFREPLRLAHQAAVLDIQKRRHHARVAIEGRRCCATCATLDGEEFSFAHAIEEAPIPNHACEHHWCACTWRGVPLPRRRRAAPRP
ncbi:MAG: hypothetical protein EXR66_02435 [Dehalococcoidia bacterium]|nr:hypothetical protein [Dehalococcoidia bacterium]